LRAKPEEKDFIEELMRIGNGTTVDEYGEVELPEQIVTYGDLTAEIYGPCIANGDYASFTKLSILAPYNEQVDEYNTKILNMMKGDATVYRSIDSVEDSKHESAARPEILNRLSSESLPEHLYTYINSRRYRFWCLKRRPLGPF
jgi:PIF1-like helicase